ncbi:MAG: class I SAM-dependent methyltransferase [Alphaproteobacteria bacterium]|nr:class I SAM-dependent methyltransferase [Alphaproteobacteria bacterium]
MAPIEDRRLAAARAILSELAARLEANLSVELWNGEAVPLGPGADGTVRIALRSPDAVRRLLLKPRLMTFFELLAAGDIALRGASPLEAADRWDHGRAVHLARRVDKLAVARAAWPFLLGGGAERAALPAFEDAVASTYARGRDDKALIGFHYDVSNEFYALFLGPEMLYSSAYFADRQTSLEAAQARKLDLVCRKLALAPGERLLDIGCGWGALLCHAAERYGVAAHGVTLSERQLDFVRARIAAKGLSGRVSVELRDYRTIEGEGLYDKIAQVEMFEHVGFANHERHFRLMHRLLKPRGLYFHQATVRRGPVGSEPFRKETNTTRVITRFIFPGGELDYIGHTVDQLGRYGFEVLDVENIREHMELTLRAWEGGLHARRTEAEALVGPERTVLWLCYFALFAKAFERAACLSYQTVAAKRAPGASGRPLDRAGLYRGGPA